VFELIGDNKKRTEGSSFRSCRCFLEETNSVIKVKENTVQCFAENVGDGNDPAQSSEDLPTLPSDDIKATCNDTQH
jgi:hypothetical protein